MKRHPTESGVPPSDMRSAEGFRDLSHRILQVANRGVPRADFICEVLKMLIDFSECHAVELRLNEEDQQFYYQTTVSPKRSLRFGIVLGSQHQYGESIPDIPEDSALEQLCKDVLRGHFDPTLSFFTRNGSFWTGNTKNPLYLTPKSKGQSSTHTIRVGGDYKSLALIPLVVVNERIGLLHLKSKRKDYFTEGEIEHYEGVADVLAVALVHQSAQAALLERVKELTCLYGIAQVAARPGISLEEMLQSIVELLPPAWQYPEIASARIILDDVMYVAPNFQDAPQKQTADIIVGGEQRGIIEVVYIEKVSELDHDPFLDEERKLIDNIARQISLLIERREAEQDKLRLQDQLMHADRLTTIGQLTASIAHELNEPLSSILGFAQLARKCSGLPKKAEEDIEKIVAGSLHAREIIRKISLFARQVPPNKTQVDLNQIVEEGLDMFESRYTKEGIEVRRVLSSNLPKITADRVQLHQVITNLMVNAMQAMPEGGRLTIQTLAYHDHISLIVEDTGVGMSEEVRKHIFDPFFTTKDEDQGTGLGLAVVHRIITFHGGSIRVDSKVGHGSRFEVQLPVTGQRDSEGNVQNE